MSLFGGLGGGNTANTERKTGTLFGSTTAPTGGLFGQSTQPSQPAPGGLFGQSTQQPQPGVNQGTSLFGAPPQGQTQRPEGGLFGGQQTQQNTSLFGGMAPAPSLPTLQAQQLQESQRGLPQLRQTMDSHFANSSVSGQREKSVRQQMELLHQKWNSEDPECAFQTYLYVQVKPEEVPFHGPQSWENEQKWEDALSKKPREGAVPMLVRGFTGIEHRIKQQNISIAGLQVRLHEMNDCLNMLKSNHELQTASRIAEARRKHIVFTQRTLALAAKTQILRNRGFAMDQTEEELKKKLVELEKKTFSPVLGGRQEEIWARMSGVRERAKILQEETEKLGNALEGQNGESLSEEDQKQVDKILKDFDQYLTTMRKWVDETQQEYQDWEKEKQPVRQGR